MAQARLGLIRAAVARTCGRSPVTWHDMDDAAVKRIFKRRLEDAARPFVPLVRASALAIPAKPGGRQTGLRARIAACAKTASWESGPRQVSVAVEIQPQRMPDREKGLPLYMEGVPEGTA